MADEHTHDHEHDHEHDHAHEHDHDESTDRAVDQEKARIRRQALAQIRQYPDVALRMKAREVTEFDEFLIQLVERMQNLMQDAQGVGLAATQVGVLQRVFIFEPEGEVGHAIVNPRIVESSDEKLTEEEGCLSLAEIRVPVERSLKVTIEGKDPNGDDVRFELEGLSARVVQHEYDHLDGVLIIDRTDPEHRKQALGELRPQPTLV